MEISEKRDPPVATAEILQRYLAICDSSLTYDFCDCQYLVDRVSDIRTGSSKERICANDIVEVQERYSVYKDPIAFRHELVLPQCDCDTNREQSESIIESDEESKQGDKRQEYDVTISASVADICRNARYGTNEKSLERKQEELLAFSGSNENAYQCVSMRPFCCVTEEDRTQECVAALTAKEQLASELLILIRKMYHAERSMLFIGLIDVINSMEQNLAELVILAEDTAHLSAPLDFLTRLTKLTEATNTPCICACKKEQLGRACCLSTGVSTVSIKIGPSYFSEKIKDIKCKTNVATINSTVTL